MFLNASLSTGTFEVEMHKFASFFLFNFDYLYIQFIRYVLLFSCWDLILIRYANCQHDAIYACGVSFYYYYILWYLFRVSTLRRIKKKPKIIIVIKRST